MEDTLVDNNAASTAPSMLASDIEKFNNERLSIIKKKYLQHDEEFIGLGYGGSESITIFIKDTFGRKIVRKILNEEFITPHWDKNGKGVMLPPVKKAVSQVNYLVNLPPETRNLFPQVLSHNLPDNTSLMTQAREYQYDMTYVGGIEISRFVREYSPSPKIVAMLYAEIFRVLKEKVHSQRRTDIVCETLEQSYFKKIEARLLLSHNTSPKVFSSQLLDADYIDLNGKTLRNWHVIIDRLRNNESFRRILEPKHHCLVVGDTNTENIKIENIKPLLNIDESLPFCFKQFDADDIGIRFLDPRAIGFHVDGVDTGVDDYMYDNKPWHNSIGNYDHIHGEHFDIGFEIGNINPKLNIMIHKDSPYYYSYSGIDRYFSYVMNSVYEYFDSEGKSHNEDPNWLVRFAFVMGTHFMAMPPFHFVKTGSGEFKDDAQSQKRALAVFAEGIRWLNCAVDILEGKRKTFLGMDVNFDTRFQYD